MAYDIVPGVDSKNRFPDSVHRAINEDYRVNANHMRNYINSGDLDTVLTDGVYPIAGLDLGNQPKRAYGTLMVSLPTGGRYHQIYITAEEKPEIYVRFSHTGQFRPWVKLHSGEITNGFLASSDDLNLLHEAGHYKISTGNVPKNAPANEPGILQNFKIGIATQQIYTTLSREKTAIYVRRADTNGNAGVWTKIGEPEPSTDPSVTRGILRNRLEARKYGISTNGKAAIALRFDDAPAEFESKILPILEKYHLPFSRITTSHSVYSEPIPAGSFDRMQDYCIKNGGEVWNHGKTHNNVVGEDAAREEVVGALKHLQTAMPKMLITCWSPPGDNHTWNGYIPNTSDTSIIDTVTGNMIYNSHALMSGYTPGTMYRILDGVAKDGQRAFSMDSSTLTYARNIMNKIQKETLGAVFMFHAHMIGRSGQMTLADFDTLMSEIADRRSRDQLNVLTVSGLAFADSIKTVDRNYALTSSGASFTVSYGELDRREDLQGSTLELSLDTSEERVTINFDGTDKSVTAKNGKVVTNYTVPYNATSLNIRGTFNHSNLRIRKI